MIDNEQQEYPVFIRPTSHTGLGAKLITKQQRKECHRDLHRFAWKILEDDNCAYPKAAFSKEEDTFYFASSYSVAFTHPSWMPQSPPPRVPMVMSDFTALEVAIVIAKSS